LDKLILLQYVLAKVQELQFGLVHFCPIGIAIRFYSIDAIKIQLYCERPWLPSSDFTE